MRSLTSGSTNVRIAALAAAIALPALTATPALAATPAPSASSTGVYGIPGTSGTGSVEGTMWNDLNRDGIHDKNEGGGVAGVQVELRANVGKYGQKLATTYTDRRGHYRFAKVPASDGTRDEMLFSLFVAAPKGWHWTKDWERQAPTGGSRVEWHYEIPAQQRTGFPKGLQLGVVDRIGIDRDSTTTVIGGLVRTAKPAPKPAPEPAPKPAPNPAPAKETGTIAGRVWNDANHNGIQDKGEKGVAKATVLLNYAPENGMQQLITRITGADGRYSFTGLAPSEVSHTAILIGTPGHGWTFTRPGTGPGNADSDAVLFTYPLSPQWAAKFAKGATIGQFPGVHVPAGATLQRDAGLIAAAATTPAPTTPPTLPTTGAGSVQWLAAGGSMVAAGGLALMILARRRRTTA